MSGCTLRAVPGGPRGGRGTLTVLVASDGEVRAALDHRDWEVLPTDAAALTKRLAQVRTGLAEALGIRVSTKGWRGDIGAVLDRADRRGARTALAVQLTLAVVAAVSVVMAVVHGAGGVAVVGALAYLLLLALAYRPRRRRPPRSRREWVVGGLLTPQVSGVDGGDRLYVWDPVAGLAGHLRLDRRARVVVHRGGLQVVRQGQVLLDVPTAQWSAEGVAELRERLSASLAVEDGKPVTVLRGPPHEVGPSRPPRPYEAGMAAVLGVGLAVLTPGLYAGLLFGAAAAGAALLGLWWAQVGRTRSTT